MKQLHGIFKVLVSENMNCSVNGNPKKRLVLEDENGNVCIATTATDSLCGYYRYYINYKYPFIYHYTRTTHNMIIDYCSEM